MLRRLLLPLAAAPLLISPAAARAATPPDTILDSGPHAGVNLLPASVDQSTGLARPHTFVFRFHSPDPTARFQCRDGEGGGVYSLWKGCTSPVRQTWPEKETHEIQIRAHHAGQEDYDPTPVSVSWSWKPDPYGTETVACLGTFHANFALGNPDECQADLPAVRLTQSRAIHLKVTCLESAGTICHGRLRLVDIAYTSGRRSFSDPTHGSVRFAVRGRRAKPLVVRLPRADVAFYRRAAHHVGDLQLVLDTRQPSGRYGASTIYRAQPR